MLAVASFEFCIHFNFPSYLKKKNFNDWNHKKNLTLAYFDNFVISKRNLLLLFINVFSNKKQLILYPRGYWSLGDIAHFTRAEVFDSRFDQNGRTLSNFCRKWRRSNEVYRLTKLNHVSNHGSNRVESWVEHLGENGRYLKSSVKQKTFFFENTFKILGEFSLRKSSLIPPMSISWQTCKCCSVHRTRRGIMSSAVFFFDPSSAL